MANILYKITVGEIMIMVVDADPTTGGGTAAPIGSIASVSGGGGIYVKNSATITDWLLQTNSTASALKANINSPTFTGSPAITTTPSVGDSSALIADTLFVGTAINNAVAGINPAVAVLAATTLASDTSGLTYNNGVGGIGAFFTGTVNTPLVFDGITLTALLQRVLIKNDTQSPSGAFNGVFYLSQLQTIGLPPILIRALDYDAPSDINNTGAIPVVSGTANANTSWLLTSNVVTVGTSPLTYVKFSLAPSTIEVNTNKDVSNGYVGLTLLKINFKNVANTILSWFTNTNTAARTYTFPDYTGNANIFARETMGNAAHVFGSGITQVALNVALTAPRVLTLPAASAFVAGTEIIFSDEFGSITTTNTITITRAGADTIDGATTEVIQSAYGFRRLFTDGVSKWTFDGGVVRLNATQTLTNKRKVPRSFSTTTLSTLTPEIDTYDVFNLTAQAGALLIANQSTSVPNDGEQIRIVILDTGSPQPITYGNKYVARGGIPLPNTTTANKLMEIGFEWKGFLNEYNLVALSQES